MKSSTNSRTGTLSGGNLSRLDAYLAAHKVDQEAVGTLRLIADMMDQIAGRNNMYMIIGATKDLTAFSLTVKGNDAPAPIYADSLLTLSTLAQDLV